MKILEQSTCKRYQFSSMKSLNSENSFVYKVIFSSIHHQHACYQNFVYTLTNKVFVLFQAQLD